MGKKNDQVGRLLGRFRLKSMREKPSKPAYPYLGAWCLKAEVDALLEDSSDLLASDDASDYDKDFVRWQRHLLLWSLGRFQQAERELDDLSVLASVPSYEAMIRQNRTHIQDHRLPNEVDF